METLPPIIVTSSLKELGRPEILEFIHKTNVIFAEQAL